jgi:hypothetical protein
MPDHNAANRLRRDVADYLLSAGNVGNLVVFDAGELETFLGANYFSQGKPLRRIALSKATLEGSRPTRCRTPESFCASLGSERVSEKAS